MDHLPPLHGMFQDGAQAPEPTWEGAGWGQVEPRLLTEHRNLQTAFCVLFGSILF